MKKAHRVLLRAAAVGILLIGGAAGPAAALPTFPGAQGFGAVATGGRGGQVLKVTTLAASGTGSLQWALNQAGPRIIVFAVSGVINGDVLIPHGDVTIAGQTAPGAGITIHGHLYTELGTSFGNIVIRHLRVRPPVANADWPPAQHDAIQFSTNHTIILDHVDISHAIDENFDLWGGAQDVTVQWSAITFPVYDGGHPDGPAHNYGILNGPDGGRISIHHNLFVHNKARTPALAEGPADVRNNVIYNGREGFVHHNPANGDFNVIGNYYKDGPSANLAPLWFDPENGPTVPDALLRLEQLGGPPRHLHRPGGQPLHHRRDSRRLLLRLLRHPVHPVQHLGGIQFLLLPWLRGDPHRDPGGRVRGRAGRGPGPGRGTWSTAGPSTRPCARTGSWGNHRPADWLQGLTPGTPPGRQ